MKRLTPEALESLADFHGKSVERDPETDQIYVTVNRVTYYAQLPSGVAR